MDTGHYNCRDYSFGPHFAPTTIVGTSTSIQRHESFDELERRSRSPASQRPKFPLFSLPLEIRQQILRYLLPYTQELRDSGRLSEHARNFSAVKKRGAKGMAIPASDGATNTTVQTSNVVWQRGNINLFSVCRRLHDECAELVYGTNTFLLFVTYAGIQWRFRWLLPSGLAPSRSYQFIELLPQRYMRLIKRVIVHVDHVDSYTSMIKYNVGAKGLIHGLKRQVQRLVLALRSTETDEVLGKQLAKLDILLKSEGSPQKSPVNLIECRDDKCGYEDGLLQKRAAETTQGLAEILQPFGYLRSVREATVGGAISTEFAMDLLQMMKSSEPVDPSVLGKVLDEAMSVSNNSGGVQLCVYGNDL